MDSRQQIIPEKKAWFVLRVNYQCEMMMKKILEDRHISCFLPVLHIRRFTPMGNPVMVVQPAISNYIFVYSSKAELNHLKGCLGSIFRLVMTQEDGQTRVSTIPGEQMKNFMAIAGNSECPVAYWDSHSLDRTGGIRVRVVAGPYQGVEGIYCATPLSGEKCVVVSVAGLFAVATPVLPSTMVEEI